MKKNLETIHNIVVGTAGHIDHGKSTLVERLTGVHPDRLPEEKARGLTIDLGFAPLVLKSGQRIGIIDVPGHERLIKNMVAGATGIDLVLLVIAADDGVMPQTREHVSIMQLLGLESGIVALTKIDMVDVDLRELVKEDIRDTLRRTFLEDAPIWSRRSQAKASMRSSRRSTNGSSPFARGTRAGSSACRSSGSSPRRASAPS
jgi:selenocysteine-specific elongation factor